MARFGPAFLLPGSQYGNFPGDAAIMDIRVVASKGGRSGEGIYTLAWDDPNRRCDMVVAAGPDTLVLR